MSKSVGKDLEHAVNSVVEQLVKRLFEVHERLKQKETNFINIHNSVVEEMEKNILQNHEKQRFFIDGENGQFELKALQNEKVIFINNEKMVQVPLSQLDSIVRSIEVSKVLSKDIEIVSQKTVQEETGFSNNESDQISEWRVMKSAAGYYVGREITEAEGDVMPYDRQSEYFKHVHEAEKALGEINHDKADENNEKPNKFVKEFKDTSYEELNKQNQDFETEIKSSGQGIVDCEDHNQRERESNQFSEMENRLKDTKVAQNIIESVKPIHLKNEEQTEKITDQEVKEKIFEKATDINHEASRQLEDNVEKSIMDTPFPMLLSSQIRGQIEVINHLKSLSDKEILKSFKDAKTSDKENKSVEQVYKGNLQQRVNAHINSSKKEY